MRARDALGCVAAVALMATSARVAAQEGAAASEAVLVIEVSSAGEGAAEGAERVGPLRTGRLARGQSRRFPVRLDADRCYAAVAQGERALTNVDVVLASGRTVLARDGSTSPSARANYCTGPRAEQARLSVTAFRGAGLFALGLFSFPVAAASTDPGTAGGHGALERLEALARAQAGNMRALSAPTRESLAEGERVERDVVLTPGRCYRVLAAGEDTIVDLDLALIAEGGRALQTDVGEAQSATLGVLRPLCPPTPGNHRLAVRIEAGSGSFAWQVFGSAERSAEPVAQAPRFRVGGSGTDFIANSVRGRHRAAGEGRPAVTDLVVTSLRTNESREVRVPVEGGHCYVVLAAGTPSVRDLDLRILDPYGNERARDHSHDALPHARVCASVGGSWRVQVRMFNGYGRVGVQAFGSPR